MSAPRFGHTYCSQCGGEFGPGNQGYSQCSDHGAPNDTPRTNAEVVKPYANVDDHMVVDATDYSAMTEHARRLERELIEAGAEILPERSAPWVCVGVGCGYRFRDGDDRPCPRCGRTARERRSI